MVLAPRLDLRQSQQLVMTPQLQQAIKLLQLTNLELTDYVTEELEKNPLLEVVEPGEPGPAEAGERTDNLVDNPIGDRAGDRAGEVAEKRANSGEAETITVDRKLESGVDSSAGGDAPLDTDMGENVFSDSGSDAPAPDAAAEQLSYNGLGAVSGVGGTGDDRGIDARFAEEKTLRDYLADQLRIIPMDAPDRMIAAVLLEMVDDSGYITDDLGVACTQIGCAEADMERVLGTMQGLEPAGIFARDLAECLKLQLIERDRFDPCMAALIENLDLLAKREFTALKRLCRVDKEDLADMIREIQELNPKPGMALSGGEPLQPVVPDVFIKKSPAGTWVVELNSATLPRVLVNTRYYAELTGKAGSKDAKAYLSDCYATANWLVKALDQRARTILKVASELVRQQEGFFAHGVRHLKPLNLKTIAEKIEMHESTVSRVTANKYISTSRGVFEMRYFFTSAISSANHGEAHSAEAVRDRIKELIDNEEARVILSDDKIVALLQEENIDIARRTVAKYREAMRIPSSVQRRREKKMLA
ncbi:MAG: RNA polymerase factor sigma-54 [Proteobacteria bacterium]|nr:RNA polymerase factor sigma-54 [Pseudomonadota bacterium]